MKRIYYIANIRIPTEKAHGLQITKTCEALGNSGVQVKLVVPTRKNYELAKEDPYDFYNVSSSFKIKKIFSLDPRFLLAAPAGIYIKVQSLLFIISLIPYLLFNRQKFDVLYTRDEILLPVLQLFSKSVIWEAHNLSSHRTNYVRYWHKCHKIFAITSKLKIELVKLGVGEDKIEILPDAVDLDVFEKVTQSPVQLRQEFKLPVDKNIIVYTGHLYDWKGTQVLADAANELSDNEVVVFIGGTQQDIERFKEKNNQQKNILILGQQLHKKIPAYLKAADVLVLPNSANREISVNYTSPMKMFEYMAAKKPIVASDLPSIREVLNNENACLVLPDSPGKLAQGIRKVLTDKDYASKIATQSFSDSQQYSWLNRAKKIISLI
ncbi:MAG: glycosyltransferase [Patescibacteria group bacterium]|jgi:glycosyltransferase involved in cell wall biosynthesis|nr:glycosyltransferase [Patescibacteria group bacterium]